LKTRLGGVPVKVAMPPILAPYGIDKINPETIYKGLSHPGLMKHPAKFEIFT